MMTADDWEDADIDGLLQQCGIAQRDLGLNLAGRRVPDLMLAARGRVVADDEMVNLAHFARFSCRLFARCHFKFMQTRMNFAVITCKYARS